MGAKLPFFAQTDVSDDERTKFLDLFFQRLLVYQKTLCQITWNFLNV